MNLTVVFRLLHFLITLKRKRPDLNFGVDGVFSMLASMAEKLPQTHSLWKNKICLSSFDNPGEVIDTQTFDGFRDIAENWLSSNSKEDLWTAWFGIPFSPSKNAFERRALGLAPSDPLTSLFAFPPCTNTRLLQPIQAPPLAAQRPPQRSDPTPAPAAIAQMTSSRKQERPVALSSTAMPLMRQSGISYPEFRTVFLLAWHCPPEMLATRLTTLLAMPIIINSTDVNVKRLVDHISEVIAARSDPSITEESGGGSDSRKRRLEDGTDRFDKRRRTGGQ